MALRRPRPLGGASTGICIDYSLETWVFNCQVAFKLKLAPHKYPKISKASYSQAEETIVEVIPPSRC